MAPISKPYTWSVFFLLPVAAALVNIDLFGDQTLAAYFFYSISAALVATLFTASLLFVPPFYRNPATALPAHLLLFIVLALFIFIHGLITHTLGLTHYYWLAGAAWFWAAGRLVLLPGSARTIAHIYKGISLLALLESLIVFSQTLHILPSKNPFYACTGSWENPNVTAMFLSLALYAVLQGIRTSRRKPLAYSLMSLILLSILLLQCRTAGVVAALFLTGHFGGPVTTFFNSRTRLFKIMAGTLTLILCIATLLLLAFGVKKVSTQGRVRVWTNSIRLIGQKPMTGQGFGRFEKEYNLFTANAGLQNNDHVNMPYNDFLELGVEGGLGAVALWAAWLIALWRHHRRQGYSVLPIVAFLVIQFTNFGIQALPAFALFLLYAAIPPEPPLPINGFIREQPRTAFFKVGLVCIQILTALLLVHQVFLADHFYDRNIITRDDTGNDAIEAYSDLAPSMNGFVSFHIYFGDAYLEMRQYRPALSQYLQGLETSSRPDLLMKCGYCAQQLRLYDSSRYYYTLVGNMLPYKFGPRLALLKLYQQQGDEPMTKRTAEDILAMPVKVESDEVNGIKKYALDVLGKEK